MKTFSFIKPDAFWAREEIMAIIQERGFAIKATKEVTLTKKDAIFLYDQHRNKPFYNELLEFSTSGEVLIMTLSKDKNTVSDFRELIGATNPADAKDGTIRRLFGTPNGGPFNAIHGSDSILRSIEEVDYFFPEG